MTHKVIEDLNWRYACKEFDKDKKISEEDFNVLLESLRLTASSFGLQLWNFVVVKNPNLREKLVEKSWGQRQVADASHLIVLCIKTDATESDIDAYLNDIVNTRNVEKESLIGFKNMLMGFVSKKSMEQKHTWMKDQVYIALGTLLTVCARMRIDSCPMEGISPKGFGEVLDLENMGLKAVLACPVGYRSSNDKYSTLPKVRFSQQEIITIID